MTILIIFLIIIVTILIIFIYSSLILSKWADEGIENKQNLTKKIT